MPTSEKFYVVVPTGSSLWGIVNFYHIADYPWWENMLAFDGKSRTSTKPDKDIQTLPDVNLSNCVRHGVYMVDNCLLTFFEINILFHFVWAIPITTL